MTTTGTGPAPSTDGQGEDERARPPTDGQVMDESSSPTPVARVPRVRSLRWAALVLVTTLAVAGVFSWLTLVAYRHTEQALLDLRAKDADSVLRASATSVHTTLAAAADLASVSGGDVARFDQQMAADVGPHAQFTTASLWRLTPTGATLLGSIGHDPDLAGSRAGVVAFLRAHHSPTALGVSHLIHGHDGLRIGYAVGAPPPASNLVAYAEVSVPGHQPVPLARSSPFADLHYAIYLGPRPRPDQLVATDQAHLPMTGTTGTTTIAFGTSAITLVVSAKQPLAGALLQDLWWIVALAGAVLALVAAGVTGWSVRRRQVAEALAVTLDVVARQNRALYRQQRTVAHTLQHALLPDRLPQLPGMQAEASYVAGVAGTEIGGDWYDLVAVDDRRAVLVMGDVSGRGLRAAAVMASLRFAARAYAIQGDPPETILARLSGLLDIGHDGHFATVLCAAVDVPGHRLTVASAGHLPPLVVGGADASFVPLRTGLPVGVAVPAAYEARTVTIPPGATLLAFTDGVVERRGELIDDGLERLRQAAQLAAGAAIEQFVTTMVEGMGLRAASDDAALLGVRWLD